MHTHLATAPKMEERAYKEPKAWWFNQQKHQVSFQEIINLTKLPDVDN